MVRHHAEPHKSFAPLRLCVIKFLSDSNKTISIIYEMSDFIIVIGRQYGAGGRKLGKLLAEKLGVPYYDKELLSEAAEALGMSKDLFIKADEKKPSLIRSFMSFNYGATSASFDSYTMSDDNLYRAQSNVIRSICDKGSCVIVGRTADYVMREHPGLISIFIHAPEEHRARNIMSRGEAASIDEALCKARKFDRSRESYYNYFTTKKWGHADSYDLTFNSSKIDTEKMVELIASSL